MASLMAKPGMRVFALVWLGQLVSIVGSGLTSFALGVWVLQGTGSVTQYTLILVFATLPGIILSPIAGALVDRWNRRYVMLLSDLGAALSTLGIALLLLAGWLDVWHIYIATGVNSIFSAFHWPAYSASVTLLVPKEHFGRAGGLMEFAQAAGQIVSPLLAGLLLITIKLEGVILIDFATFLFAVTTMLLVRIPQPKRVTEESAEQSSLLRDALYGWKYITARPGLLALLLFFAAVYFSAGMIGVLIPPLVLNFADSDVLGVVIGIAFTGMLLGSIVMGTWGGPKRRVSAVLALALVQSILIIMDGLQPSALLITVVGFAYLFVDPIITGCDQAIWMSKTPPQVQGRVFATRRMISWSTLPVAFLAGGLLSDNVFEPLMMPGGALAGSIGQIIGVGPGRGIALLFIVMGTLMLLVTVRASLYPRLRNLEEELPDVVPDEAPAGVEAPELVLDTSNPDV
jgi:MFS family permease